MGFSGQLGRRQATYHRQCSINHSSSSMSITMRHVSVLVFILGCGHVLSQDGTGSGLPAGSEDILQYPNSDTFSCEGQGYGYYADVQSGCQVFHICLPIEDNDGNVIETAKWSFFCGNATVFDQETLTCNYPENAFPCEESPSLYGSVEFGKIPDDY